MKESPAELLKRLVRIDTSDPPGNERALLTVLRDLLAEEGIASTIQETAPGRGNLLARLPATRPGGKPIVLLSHVDVVAADPAQWEHPPFAAEEHEGYIHGRGTVDTKQLTVMELAAFTALAKEPERTRDVYFLATSDEECGSALGLQAFLAGGIELCGRRLGGAELFAGSDVISEGGGFPCVVGGGELYLCETGQKGCGTVIFTVRLKAPRGPFLTSGEALVRATGLAREIGALEPEARELETLRRFREKMAQAGGTDWEEKLSPGMKNILTAMGRNTLTVTMLRGKTQNEVEVVCDARLLPGFGLGWLEKLAGGLAEKWECEYRVEQFHEGYENAGFGPVLDILERATLDALRDGKTARRVVPFVSMGSSDGRFLAPLGARVYGYSPVHAWDMTFDTAVRMVHGVNERIHRDSVRLGCDVLTAALREMTRA